VPLRSDTVTMIGRLADLAVRQTSERPSGDDVMGFYDREWPLQDATVAALRDDAALHNRTGPEIANDLWRFLDDLREESARFADRAALRACVKAFSEEMVRETQQFEVMVAIEGISLADEQIILGRAKFFHFAQEQARLWGIYDAPIYDRLHGVVDRTVGLVRVSAGSFEKAWELAMPEIDSGRVLGGV
jgi:hypothetical protein